MKNKKITIGTILLLFAISGFCNITISNAWTDEFNLNPLSHGYYDLGYLHVGSIIHMNEISADRIIDTYIMNDEDFDNIGISWDYIIRWEDMTYLSNYDYDVTVYDRYYIVFRNKGILFSRTVQVDINVEKADITITSPTYYDTFENGNNYITWTSTGSINYVKIDLYKNRVFLETITSLTYNDGSYSWYIYNDDYTDDSDYQIKISNYYDDFVYDYSSYFTIESEIKSITITLPTSYTTIQSGYNDITWTSTGTINYVKIELYKNGAFLETIDSYEYNDGSYSWYIYDDDYTDGSEYQIKILNYYDNYIYDYSSYFTIEVESEEPDPYDPNRNLWNIINNIIFMIVIPLCIVLAIAIPIAVLVKKHKRKSKI